MPNKPFDSPHKACTKIPRTGQFLEAFNTLFTTLLHAISAETTGRARDSS